MNKTFKKSNITNYINRKNLRENISEEEISEFVDGNGSLISKDNNYVANTNYIKSKKTTDDYVRNATQGPEAYFIYGGPYYGINYNYVVSEEEDILSEEGDMYDELNVVPDIDTMDSGRKLADKDIRKHYHKRGFPDQDYKDSSEWSRHSLPYDTEFKMTIDKLYKTSMVVTIETKQFYIAIPKNSSWYDIELVEGLEYTVKKEQYFSGTREFAKLTYVENTKKYRHFEPEKMVYLSDGVFIHEDDCWF